MRILKFIGAFLGTLILIFFIVFGFNLDALNTLYQNSGDLQEGQEWVSKATSLKGLTQYIGEQPSHVSVVSRSVTNPDTTIAYGADKSRTMGTLSNFFLITTYARLVEAGLIDPRKMVSLDSVDRYQLPFIDASHHENAKTALDNQDVITDDNNVPLHDLVQNMIIYNEFGSSRFPIQSSWPRGCWSNPSGNWVCSIPTIPFLFPDSTLPVHHRAGKLGL
ncbi:MAG: hypothetical protein U5J63_10950 [Fodinibius sp.]|nr:hypothetical protein [Fodinibius sp.]